MRLILVATAAALLAACASTPQSPPAAAKPSMGAVVPKDAAKADADKFDVIDATNIVEAQKAGWKVVNQNGTQMYCKKEQVTGTRLGKRTVCLTAEEMQARADAGRDAMTIKQSPYYDVSRK